MLSIEEAAKDRKKVVCILCTTDDERPIMVEEKSWKAHLGSRQHKRARRHLLKTSRDPNERPRKGELREQARQLDDAEDILVDSASLFMPINERVD